MQSLYWLELKILRKIIIQFFVTFMIMIGTMVVIAYYSYSSYLYLQYLLFASMFITKYTLRYYVQCYWNFLPSLKHIKEYLIVRIVFDAILTLFVSIIISIIFLILGKFNDIGLLNFFIYYFLVTIEVILNSILSLHFHKIISAIIFTALFIVPCILIIIADLFNNKIYSFLLIPFLGLCILLIIILFQKINIEQIINNNLK